MTTPPSGSRQREAFDIDPGYLEPQQDRIAGRALAFLVTLNGAAALIMLSAFAFGLQSTEPKLVAAMLVFGSGAITGLLSTFLTFLNRVIRAEAPQRVSLRDGLRVVAMVAVVASGASFLIGLNMVGTATTSRSSTHPKTKIEDRGLAAAPTSSTDAASSAAGFDPETRGRAL
jgi:hypothetical protein